MLTKISGLARALYIVLAIITAFVALGALDVALTLVVLGLIAGITMPRDRMVLVAATVIALPYVGTALGNIPAIGAQLNAFALNLQLGVAGALGSSSIAGSASWYCALADAVNNADKTTARANEMSDMLRGPKSAAGAQGILSRWR